MINVVLMVHESGNLICILSYSRNNFQPASSRLYVGWFLFFQLTIHQNVPFKGEIQVILNVKPFCCHLVFNILFVRAKGLYSLPNNACTLKVLPFIVVTCYWLIHCISQKVHLHLWIAANTDSNVILKSSHGQKLYDICNMTRASYDSGHIQVCAVPANDSICARTLLIILYRRLVVFAIDMARADLHTKKIVHMFSHKDLVYSLITQIFHDHH